MTHTFRYVPWSLVPRYHAIGWFITCDMGPPHNQYSSMMERLCECGAMPESPAPGGYATEPTIAGASLTAGGLPTQQQPAAQCVDSTKTRPATPPALGPDKAGSVAG